MQADTPNDIGVLRSRPIPISSAFSLFLRPVFPTSGIEGVRFSPLFVNGFISVRGSVEHSLHFCQPKVGEEINPFDARPEMRRFLGSQTRGAIKPKLFIISSLFGNLATISRLKPSNGKMPKFFRELRRNGEFRAKIQPSAPIFALRSPIEISIQK
jgi:hypothetical protein